MQLRAVSIVASLLFTLLASCNKENKAQPDCYADATTVRQITNKQATITLINGDFYIIEQGAIDTRLKACNLAQEFQVNNLPVTVSGAVKATNGSNTAPCCTESFVITNISR